MENQRVRISKKMLKEALLKLLEHKDIDKITIFELCQEAQINRTTFYRCYGSIYDVIDEIKDEFIADLDSHIFAENADTVDALEASLEFARQNQALTGILLRTYSRDAFLEEVFDRRHVIDQIGRETFLDLDGWKRDYAAAYAIHGSYEMIRRWILSDDPISAREIAELILDINRRA